MEWVDEAFKKAVLSNWENARDNGYYDDNDFEWLDVAYDMIAFAEDMEDYANEYGDEVVALAIVQVLEHTE